jgi:hypothetical protein
MAILASRRCGGTVVEVVERGDECIYTFGSLYMERYHVLFLAFLAFVAFFSSTIELDPRVSENIHQLTR